jgi:glycosyltransferase involved in cell wall biosynthesis
MENQIWLFSNSEMASGAEVVLKEYAEHSKFYFRAIVTSNREVLDFFRDSQHISISHICPGAIKSYKNKFFSKVKNLFTMFHQAHHLACFAKKNSIKFLYVNNTIAVSVAGIAHVVFGMKCVVVGHIHDMMTASSFSSFIKSFCRDFRFIAVSKKCKQELIEVCGIEEDRIAVAYNGVEVSEQLCSPNRVFTIGVAGSITERKGIIYLAQAYRELLEEGEKVKLEIAYNFLDDVYYEKVKGELEGCSYNMETYEHDQMRSFYEKIDVLVVPSINDPLPTAVLEAMNYGVLVTGSNVDGIVEMIPKDFLFSCKNVTEMKSILKRIIHMSEEERNNVKDKNHERVENVFSIDICSKKKDDIITECFQKN